MKIQSTVQEIKDIKLAHKEGKQIQYQSLYSPYLWKDVNTDNFQPSLYYKFRVRENENTQSKRHN